MFVHPPHGSQRMVTDGNSFKVVAGDPRPPPKAAVASSEERGWSNWKCQGVGSVHKESTGQQTQVDCRRCSSRIDENQGRIEATCCGGGNRPLSKVHCQAIHCLKFSLLQREECAFFLCRKFIAKPFIV